MTVSNKSAAKAPLSDPIDHIVANEIKILRLFFERRSVAIRVLFTEALLPSYMRDELIREVILNFMQGQPLRLGNCQRLLKRYGPSSLFNQEIHILKKNGLVFLERDLSDPQETLIRATAKLVDFYRFQLPRLEADAREIFNIPKLEPPALNRKYRTRAC